VSESRFTAKSEDKTDTEISSSFTFYVLKTRPEQGKCFCFFVSEGMSDVMANHTVYRQVSNQLQLLYLTTEDPTFETMQPLKIVFKIKNSVI
jgi:hypothetical protein